MCAFFEIFSENKMIIAKRCQYIGPEILQGDKACLFQLRASLQLQKNCF